LRVAELHTHRQRTVFAIQRNLERTLGSVQRDRSPVGAGFYRLDPGCGARCEKCQHPVPIVRRPKAQVEQILILRLMKSVPGEMADLGWRTIVHAADPGIESAHRPET